jgi:hypothetical protein
MSRFCLALGRNYQPVCSTKRSRVTSCVRICRCTCPLPLEYLCENLVRANDDFRRTAEKLTLNYGTLTVFSTIAFRTKTGVRQKPRALTECDDAIMLEICDADLRCAHSCVRS